MLGFKQGKVIGIAKEIAEQHFKGMEKEQVLSVLSTVVLNPDDYLEMGSPEKVLVTSGDGKHSVAVYAYPTDAMSRGHVFMPRAIWSNVVVDPETFSTGSPLYKGSPVRIEPTEEPVQNACDLVVLLFPRRK